MKIIKVASIIPAENSNKKFGSSHVQFRYIVLPLQRVY